MHSNLIIAIRLANRNQIAQGIIEHNYYVHLVHYINTAVRLIILILYYIFSIFAEFVVYSVHNVNTTWLAKLGGVVLIILYLVIILALIILVTSIPRSAHKPYKLLLSYMSQTPSLSLRERLKIMAFIERLSPNEPPIGFYCYDLFPFNSYEFYQFVFIAGSNYLLLMQFF